MNKTTTLTLTEDQLERLLDGMLSVEEPLNTGKPGCLRFKHRDQKDHDALTQRLKKALERVA